MWTNRLTSLIVKSRSHSCTAISTACLRSTCRIGEKRNKMPKWLRSVYLTWTKMCLFPMLLKDYLSTRTAYHLTLMASTYSICNMKQTVEWYMSTHWPLRRLKRCLHSQWRTKLCHMVSLQRTSKEIYLSYLFRGVKWSSLIMLRRTNSKWSLPCLTQF